jgi:hypothetical protein
MFSGTALSKRYLIDNFGVDDGENYHYQPKGAPQYFDSKNVFFKF